ncbi:hypothetical protein I4F81_002019 [Pyropia yezoensis]|uniref:Uncharacterized protein n=1 Tax=Pyropia yezoensis TaxID=2788 RepID=A0ACC3BP82_PYRYE|nr:hypothetical protein I4F81_002019 [Neopyropia yezoensis]
MAAVAAARDDASAAAAAAATTLTRTRSEAASHPRAPGVDAAVRDAAATVDRARAAAAAAAADHEALRSRAAAAFEALPPAARRLFGPSYDQHEADADVIARLSRGVLLVDGLGALAAGAGAAAAAAARQSVADWAASSRVRVVTGDVSPVAAAGGKGEGKSWGGAAAGRPPKVVVIGAD